MESSRRPIQKAREFGLKKARLGEEPERVRVPGADAGGVFTSRFRDVSGRGRVTVVEDRDRLDPVRGAYNQQQELLSQYKTAIAELTFNSKPIITNLTIIAGENTHAAKGIAATVCNNILEVPKEQKLPSLYLLDSIVKNIGGDYIKYFAGKLPEVFCKAYRQVDASIHPSMQHLFKTWKGVFPPPPLRIIEQELSFSSSKGGSSLSVPPLRSESQSQRPGHSIHVNPKYLEARQRLEQSNKSKGIETEDSGSTLGEEAERSSLSLVSDDTKQWTEAPANKLANMQPSQRAERLADPSYSKGSRPRYVDYELTSNRASLQDLGIRRTGDQVADGVEAADQTWYGVENDEGSTAGGKRNGYGAPSHGLVDSYGNYRAPPATQSALHRDQASPFADLAQRGIFRNWKNSEEEEFMWDDMDSKTTGLGAADRLKKVGWNHDPLEKAPSVEVPKCVSTGFAQRESKWRCTDNLSRSEKPLGADDKFHKKELGHHLQQSHSQKDVGSRDKREASVDSSSVGQAFEVPVVRQMGWFQQDQLSQPHSTCRSHLTDSLKYSPVPSADSGQLVGYNTAMVRHQSLNVVPPSLSRKRHGSQIQSGVSPSSGSTQSTPLFSEIPGHHPQRPHSPATLASVQQPQLSPSSARQLHMQTQQPGKFSGCNDSPPAAVSGSTVQTNSHDIRLGNAPKQFKGNEERSFISQGHAQVSILPQSQPSQLLQPLQSFHGVSSLAPPITNLSEVFHQPEQSRKSHAHPQGLGYTDSSLDKKSSSSLPGQLSAEGILAALMKGGLLTVQGNVSTDTPNSASFSNMSHANSGVVQSHSSDQHNLADPPLPPAQPSASANSLSSFSSVLGPSAPGASANMLPQATTSQPPLPPGPPPPSSVVGTLTENPSSGNVTKNPLSHLLHSLVVKGLISTSAPEQPSKSCSVQVSSQVEGQSEGPVTGRYIPVALDLVSASPPSPPDGELSVSESSSMPSGRSNVPVEIKDQIGVDFKPDVIREIHLSVINSLFDDLQHQCTICGLRFKLKKDLNRHLDWHSSRKLELDGKRLSRKWYASLREWVEGFDLSYITSHPPASEISLPTDGAEPMVPADESQCICALCGESFEDFYCHKRDTWMFKGAAYMTILSDGSGSSDGVSSPKVIVHANCTTRCTVSGVEKPQSYHMARTIR